MSEIGVAMGQRSGDLFGELQASGRIAQSFRAVLLNRDGNIVEGDPVGTQVLWRGSRSADWVKASAANLPDLAWVHSDAVGVETLPVQDLSRAGIVVTNGAGNFSRPMAEWVMLGILAAAKDVARFVRHSDEGVWEPGPQLGELDSAVVLILGLGSVGSLVAQMAQPFGLEVRACVRQARPSAPSGVSKLIVGDAWKAELQSADYVVITLPLTEQTRSSIGKEALGAMKPGAWIINVARGAIIDEDALIASLDSGHLGGAVLDTFATEPLPQGHPLWGRPNVLVLPHHTWSSRRAGERAIELFASQLDRWARDDPLENQVDAGAGY
ncbi:MAG: D-2-hydroxyacid dehydrogenase [Acidimicrobiales bacterium]